MTSLDSDPIHAAIATFRSATAATDAAIVELQRLYKPGDKDVPSLDPVSDAENAAALAVVNTVPTTRAGLEALEAHLANDRSSLCWWWIRNQLLEEGQTFDDPCSVREYFSIPVARFVARRAAEFA
jgi:hypothetical protein